MEAHLADVHRKLVDLTWEMKTKARGFWHDANVK